MEERSIRPPGTAPAVRGVLRLVAIPALAALTLAAMLPSACGKVPPVTPADLVPVDLQSVSTWNTELAGTALGEIVGTGGTFSECMGYIDAFEHLGAPPQTRLDGWAWNTAASEAFESFVVTDRNGLIAGAGTTSVERADVKAAFPGTVRHDFVGFVAFAAPDAQSLTVYGVNMTNDSVCAIGSTG